MISLYFLCKSWKLGHAETVYSIRPNFIHETNKICDIFSLAENEIHHRPKPSSGLGLRMYTIFARP